MPVKAGGVNKGTLNPSTPLSNESTFERDRVGGTPQSGKIAGMQSLKSDSLDCSGLDASGDWLKKNGTPYGEAALFNQLPPGMDISDQQFALINNMTMRSYGGGVTYPGDTPWPVRDVPE